MARLRLPHALDQIEIPSGDCARMVREEPGTEHRALRSVCGVIAVDEEIARKRVAESAVLDAAFLRAGVHLTVSPEQVALLVSAARTGRLCVLGVERAASTEGSAGCEKGILGRHGASARVLCGSTAIKGLRIRMGYREWRSRTRSIEVRNRSGRGLESSPTIERIPLERDTPSHRSTRNSG